MIGTVPGGVVETAPGPFEQDVAGQRVAVAPQARGQQPHQGVTDVDALRRLYALLGTKDELAGD